MSYSNFEESVQNIMRTYGFTVSAPTSMVVSLDSCAGLAPAPAVPCAPAKKVGFKAMAKEQKGVKAMYHDYDEELTTDEAKKRHYLYGRLSSLDHQKYRELRKTFKMDDDERPSTLKELKERLLAGKFVIPMADDPQAGTQTRYIDFYDLKWRDPSEKADEAGFDAAVKRKDKANVETTDVIVVGAIAEALDAVKKFESTDFAVA